MAAYIAVQNLIVNGIWVWIKEVRKWSEWATEISISKRFKSGRHKSFTFGHYKGWIGKGRGRQRWRRGRDWTGDTPHSFKNRTLITLEARFDCRWVKSCCCLCGDSEGLLGQDLSVPIADNEHLSPPPPKASRRMGTIDQKANTFLPAVKTARSNIGHCSSCCMRLADQNFGM